jgi:FAD/FMN-containing dehydrogenase
VDAEFVDALRAIVGDRNVLTGREAVEPYTHDEVAGLRADPDVVVTVESADQASRVMRLAERARVPVTPRGAGTGLSGGAVPVSGGIVLSLEKMNRILEIDKANLMVTVEPGVITGNLHRAVEAEGLFYPPDPASLDSCTIGGNIAEGSGGPRAVKYGVTKDYVCSLEAVLPSGEIITCGRKLVKDVTGYNLTQLQSPVNHMQDVVVPRAEIPNLLRGIREIARRHSVRIVSFGHAGDWNVHINTLKDQMPDDEWRALVPEVIDEEIYGLTLSLGGMLTAEHGVGVTRRPYLPMALSESQIEIMRGIKAAFDPHGLLNPGKVLP